MKMKNCKMKYFLALTGFVSFAILGWYGLLIFMVITLVMVIVRNNK